jgi:hypothetical protein
MVGLRSGLFSTLPCGGLVKSSGIPAKDSTYPAGHSLAVSTMTAYPSRCTRTVSVAKRNSFGRRIAWLLPVQNTLALLAFTVSSRDMYGDTYNRGWVSSVRTSGIEDSSAPRRSGMCDATKVWPSKESEHTQSVFLSVTLIDRYVLAEYLMAG